MSPRTLYIAGPMTGLPDFNYPAFNAAAEYLQQLGFATLNPVDSEALNDTGVPQAWAWYMRHALRMVLQADGIALLDGWEHSRGARLEVKVANELGIPACALSVWEHAAAEVTA